MNHPHQDMRLSKFSKIDGSSILESVIAITVISICILVFVTIYGSVIQGYGMEPYQKAVYEIDWFVQKREFKTFEDISFNFENPGYNVQLEIVEKNQYSCLVKFDFKIAKRNYSVIRYIHLEDDSQD